MSLRKVVLDPKKQKRFEENKKKSKQNLKMTEGKNRYIPQADVDMLVLDKYDKEFED